MCHATRGIASRTQTTVNNILQNQSALKPAEIPQEKKEEILQVYEDGFRQIAKDLSEVEEPEAEVIKATHYNPLFIRAQMDVMKMKRKNPPDVDGLIARYQSFFEAAAQLPEITSSAMIGGPVGQAIQTIPKVETALKPATTVEKTAQERKIEPVNVIVEEIEEVYVG